MAYSWRRNAAEVLDVQASGPAATVADPAADDAQQKRVGNLIVQFYDYLKANAQAHPDLAPAITELRSAVATYRSGQGDPAASLKRVLAAVHSARAADPTIP